MIGSLKQKILIGNRTAYLSLDFFSGYNIMKLIFNFKGMILPWLKEEKYLAVKSLLRF
jgi:hypothetical protein